MAVRHAFVVPAYGHSPYLEACLGSLAGQGSPSPILLATSTPFPGLETVCQKHGVHLHVHGPNRGIGHDWNRALELADAEWVTVAHQDDVYRHDFSRKVMHTAERADDCAFVFTDAEEIDASGYIRGAGTNQRIKRGLVKLAFLGRQQAEGAWLRRALLGLGNAVNCPTVTLNMRRHPHFRFRQDLRTNMDWMAWVELTREAGVAYVADTLVAHRVHADSETARCLDDGSRSREDRMVFDALWPASISSSLQRLYAMSYRGYLP